MPDDTRFGALLDNALVTGTLLIVTVVSSLSLLRVFTTRELSTAIVIAASATIVMTFLARTVGAPWFLGLAGSFLAEVSLLAYWIHRTAGVHIDSSTPRFAVTVMHEAWSTIDELKTPTPLRLGFALMVLIGTWMVASVADTLAFRLRSPLEALIPMVALVAVSSALTRHAHPVSRVRSAAAIVAAGVLHLFVVALVERRRTRSWFGDVRPRRVVAVGGSAVAAGAIAGIVLLTIPGSALATLEPTVDLHVNTAASKPRVVASPLVSMRRQLLVLSNREQFTVQSLTADGQPSRAYWRQTALESFDGASWTGSGSFSSIADRSTLPRGSDVAAGPEVREEFRIGALASTWLPVAYRVTSIDAPDLPVDAVLSFDPETASLITKRASVEGLTYQVVSHLPATSVDADLVSSADASSSSDPLLALPLDFPDRVRQLAKEITANETTLLGKAKALQDYLRTFRYTTDVPAPSNVSDLERFLFDEQAGYCEQFAGSFAAMARAVGIPARVAVGFTPGRYDATDGRFHITGRNAHAWPEVFVDGSGWVAFEPTPGRGIPGAEAITGVPDQDASEGIGPQPEPQAQTTAPTIPTADSTPAPTVAGSPTTLPAGAVPSPGTAVGSPPARGRRHGARLLVLVGITGLLLLVVSGRAAFDIVRDRRARSTSPGASVERSWARVLRALSWVQLRPQQHETPPAFARRAVRAAPGAEVVAALVTEARFGRQDALSSDAADVADRTSRECEARVKEALPWWSRLAHHVGVPPVRRPGVEEP